MDVLEHLVEEHRSVEALLHTLSGTEPGHVRDKTLDALVTSLRKHMALEERYVYPIAQRVAGEDAEKGAENEHELARAGLEQMVALRAEPGFGAALEMVQAGIAHHVEEEEQEVFPRLRKKAAREIDDLGDAGQLEASLETASRPDGTAPEEIAAEGGGPEEIIDLTKDELYERAKEAGIEGRSSMSKAELAAALTRR